MAQYRSHTEEGECIFCKIAEGSFHTPGIFWENDKYMAFLSIYPNTEGFSIVMPKSHWPSDVLALPDDELQKLILATKEVNKILLETMDDVGRIGLIMEGTGINHAHIKLFPMHGTEHLKKGQWRQYRSDIDKFYGNYEGYFCTNDGPRASDEAIERMANRLRAVSGYTK